MVTITDFNGLDLTTNPPDKTVIRTPAAATTANVRIECLIIESGTLPLSRLSGTLYWNDGSLPVVYTDTGTITVDATRKLRAGDYLVRVEGHNYAVDDSNVSAINFPVQIQVMSSGAVAANIIFGPILPKDAGFPNSEQWLFDTGADLEVLASSVKMLLTTTKGERIMLPEYGTNLKLLLFEYQGAGLESMAQQQILEAITRWEPRVALQGISVDKTGEREITVLVNFVSKLNQQDFSLNLSFTA